MLQPCPFLKAKYKAVSFSSPSVNNKKEKKLNNYLSVPLITTIPLQ